MNYFVSCYVVWRLEKDWFYVSFESCCFLDYSLIFGGD